MEAEFNDFFVRNRTYLVNTPMYMVTLWIPSVIKYDRRRGWNLVY